MMKDRIKKANFFSAKMKLTDARARALDKCHKVYVNFVAAVIEQWNGKLENNLFNDSERA